MNKILAALKLLVKNPFYLVLTLFLAFILFIVYFAVNDLSYYRTAFGISTSLWFIWKVFSHHIWLIAQSSGWVNIGAIGLVAALGGINLSLTVLRVVRTKVFIGRTGFTSLLGTFGGAFAASCSACSTALVSFFGISGGLALFPFRGLEISLLAATVLLISLYFLGKSLVEFGQA